MGKFFHDDVLDALLNYIADNGDIMFVCSAQPATYEQASVDMMLAQIALDTGDGNGDYTIADGDASGRKLTVAEQAIASADNTGAANHIAICDSGNTKILAVTTLGGAGSFAVTSGQPVTVPVTTVSNPDPV